MDSSDQGLDSQNILKKKFLLNCHFLIIFQLKKKVKNILYFQKFFLRIFSSFFIRLFLRQNLKKLFLRKILKSIFENLLRIFQELHFRLLLTSYALCVIYLKKFHNLFLKKNFMNPAPDHKLM